MCASRIRNHVAFITNCFYNNQIAFIKLTKHQTSNRALNLVKTNGGQPEAKCLAKNFETLIKTIYLLLCTAKHPHPIFCLLLPNLILKYFHFSSHFRIPIPI